MAKSTLEIGDFTTLNIKIKNTGAAAKFRLEYAVSYLKKNGTHNDKVFQISEKEFVKNQEETIVKKVDFKDLSTRKHHAGKHFISLKINGVVQKKIEFELY